MRLTRFRVRLALGAFLLVPGALSAQTIPSPYEYLERKQEIGPVFGHVTAGTGRFDFGPSGGLLLGARYGLELTGPLSLEGTAGVIDGTRNVVASDSELGGRVIDETDALVTVISAGLRFTLTGRRSWRRLAPFVAVGGGVAFDAAGDSEADRRLLPEDVFDFGTSFWGTLGVGSRISLTDTFALRAEGVFSLWQLDTPPGFSDPQRGIENVEDSQWVNATTLSLAILYRW